MGGDRNVYAKTSSDMEVVLDGMVRCVKGLPDSANLAGRLRVEMAYYEKTSGPKPIYILNETYRKERHELVAQQVWEDERSKAWLQILVLDSFIVKSSSRGPMSPWQQPTTF
jgi:hypothetical protein